MAHDNPYESPTPEQRRAGDPAYHRFSNLNHAGVPLAVVFVVLPLILAGLIYLAITGRMVNAAGEPARGSAIGFAILAGIAQLVGLIYAWNVPVLWTEIGPTIRYRTLARLHEFEWGDVQRIWFDQEDSSARVLPFLYVTLAIHHVLVIEINDYKDLRVIVGEDTRAYLSDILKTHRNFRDSPYDDADEGEEQ